MSSIHRTLPALLTILAAACAGRGSPRPVSPDTLTPVTPPPVAQPPVSDALAALGEGEVRASVEFGRMLADSEVVALAARHGVQPYEVWLMVGDAPTSFEVPPGRPAGGAIQAARRGSAIHSGPFQDFAREANSGGVFRFFPDREQAVAWL